MTLNPSVARSRRARPSRTVAGVWLKGLLLQLCTQALRDAVRIPRWPETAVHALRKRMKKLQSLVRLVPPGPEPAQLQSLRAVLRQLKGVVAAQRDHDVLVALDQDLGVQPRGRLRVRRAIAAAPAARLGLARAMIRQVQALDLEALTWDEVARRYRKTCRRARQAWANAQRQPSVDELHDWRKRVKDLHYQSLALHPWLRRRKPIRRTHHLGALLGHRLDLDLYAARLTRDQRRPPRKILVEVKDRRRRLTRRIFQRGKQVFARPLPRLKSPGRAHP